jgi:hypothetical protein
VASALEGFLAYDCDDDLAARLRREIEEAVEEFLSALPDVAPGPRMYGRPRRVIVPPPPSD